MALQVLSKMREFIIRLAHLMGHSPLLGRLEVELPQPAEQAIPLELVSNHRRLDYNHLLVAGSNRQKAITTMPRACTYQHHFLRLVAHILPQAVGIDCHHNFGGRIHRRDSGTPKQEQHQKAR